MKKYQVLLLFLLITLSSFGIDLKVGIHSNIRSKSLIVVSASGAYEVFGNGKKIMELRAGNFVNVKVEKNAVGINNFDKHYGHYSSIKFVAMVPGSCFRLKSIHPATDTYVYDDNLELLLIKGAIRTVNNVDIEAYVAGVVESEAGKNATSEFLKLQAIICRTYALGLTNRHPGSGYQMCDNVHCQVYRGKSRFNPEILSAVKVTKGKVIADANFQLITAAFHSNCGGQTVASEDVWGSPLPYLKSVKDTFCCKKPHAVWEKKVRSYDWMNYLVMKSKKGVFANPVADTSNKVIGDRKLIYAYKSYQVPSKHMRNDWGLRSTYFVTHERNDSIIIKGVGFGHGVGMCQEGAMRMAELGYSYQDIIKFYYKNVGVIDLSNLRFFND